MRWVPPILAWLIPALAQDPYLTVPRNYQPEFENDWVRISRVRYQPGDRLPVHSHPALPTIYVYVADGGPIRFSHQTPRFIVERPAVAAGSVRFNRNAQQETHEVAYLGDTPTEYLRVELKTVPGARHRDARLSKDGDFPWEDEQVRINRVDAAPARLSRRAVIVDIGAHSAQWYDPSRAAAPAVKPGRYIVLELKTGIAPASR